MNFVEAKRIVNDLQQYTGLPIVPLRAPVKKTMIVPAGQKEFDMMVKNIMDNNVQFETALKPYMDNVMVLVFFDVEGANAGTPPYCTYSFLQKNCGLPHTA